MKQEAATAVDVRQWAPEQAADALRAAGCRVTGPRVAVLRSLLEIDSTVDAPTLTAHAAQYQPGIHEATVYRTVNVLCEAGLASHVHAGHGPSLVRLGGDDQLVAMCQRCGAIEPVPAGHLQALVDEMRASTGFTLVPGHFALEGV